MNGAGQPAPPPAPRTPLWATLVQPPIITAALLVAATGAWLFHFHWKLGHYNEWYIEVLPPPWPLSSWLLPCSVLLLLGGLAALSAFDRFRRAHTRQAQTVSTVMCLAALMALSLLWPWALLGGGGVANLIATTWSDLSNGYFGASYEITDPREFTRTYAAERQQPVSRLEAHVATHPPGAVLFYYGARRIYDNAPLMQQAFTALAERLTAAPVQNLAAEMQDWRLKAGYSTGHTNKNPPRLLPDSAVPAALWCAFLIAVATASVVLAVYLMAAAEPDGGWNEARGLVATALFALAPSISLFDFALDALIASGIAWTLVLASRRLCGGGPAWVFCSGLALACVTFLSLGAVAIGLAIAVALCLYRWTMPQSIVSDSARDVVTLLLGFGAGCILLLLCFPMQPVQIIAQAMTWHRIATLAMRTYSWWVWFNLVVFFLFSGWPLIVACVTAAARRWRAPRVAWPPGLAIGTACAATLIALTLSGKVLGEVERLWLFLLAPMCVLGAFAWPAASEADKPVSRAGWIVLFVLQAAQTLMMAAALNPLTRPL